VKGDLIKLSAYGEKLKCLARYRNKVGMVLESSVSAGDLGYMVLWSGETKIMRMRIRDVKFVK
jgi:hypothetical protein|tara:strand:- start:728 stop:916 length:189 start_codon:yes stop_codon:yes gene_type:complete